MRGWPPMAPGEFRRRPARPHARESGHAVHGSRLRERRLPFTIFRKGPLKLTVPVSPAYTSVSFYTRNNVAYYAINDRAAGRRVIELDLMTTAQHEQVPEDEEITAADRLIVESPTPDRDHRHQGDGTRARLDARGAKYCCRLTMRGAGGACAAAQVTSAGRSEARLADPGRRQRAIARDLVLQLVEHSFRFDRFRLWRRDDQALEREVIRRDPIREALVHDFHDVRVLPDAALGVDLLALVQPGHISQTFLPLLIDIHHTAGRFEKLRQARRIVADVVDQLRITRQTANDANPTSGDRNTCVSQRG